MNKMLLAAGLAVVLGACNSSKKSNDSGANPFFSEYTTPYGVPPFDKIKITDYKPAFLKGIDEHNKEIDAIVNNKETPNFENTLARFDQSGELLEKVSIVFSEESSCNTNDQIQALQLELQPLLTKHYDDIYLNPKLFQRIKTVRESPDTAKLDKEQMKLLTETYKTFVRGGAALNASDQAKLRPTFP